jgi:hypothetical protein
MKQVTTKIKLMVTHIIVCVSVPPVALLTISIDANRHDVNILPIANIESKNPPTRIPVVIKTHLIFMSDHSPDIRISYV